ncbi:hypothetical protein C1646_676949 [Rhizophagus diaphanus]|nr:hypothetical protein C1646_676949 [Rhizophagus diaphanus] [Rhizophagus sp. MUCL 43196]
MYDGAVQIIKCIEVINVGEEINISYIDVALDRVTRKKMLQEKYFFECQCSRCSVQERYSGIFSKIDQLIEEKDQEILKKDFNTSLENWVSSKSKLEQNESKFSKVTKYHPMIGLHLFTLGKCYWNDITNGLESVKESINILECAQKVLNSTHNEGAENVDIINQVNDLLNTARKDLSCV